MTGEPVLLKSAMFAATSSMPVMFMDVEPSPRFPFAPTLGEQDFVFHLGDIVWAPAPTPIVAAFERPILADTYTGLPRLAQMAVQPTRTPTLAEVSS